MTRMRCAGFAVKYYSVVVFGTILFAGCGYSEYEARLNESKKYYAYLDKVEQFLAPKWSAPEIGMELRVPRQFFLIPPPQEQKLEDGTIVKPVGDPRQPDYLDLTFPELYGAWEAPFTVLKPEGAVEERKGYLYVLCNYWQLTGQQSSDAGQFLTTLKAYLTDKLQITPVDERTEYQPAGYPAYQPQKAYEAFTYKGKDINGVNYTFEVYSRVNGSITGVIILVTPEGMESPQRLSERLPLMLGSFNFTNQPPQPGMDRNSTQQNAAPTQSGF